MSAVGGKGSKMPGDEEIAKESRIQFRRKQWRKRVESAPSGTEILPARIDLGPSNRAYDGNSVTAYCGMLSD
jgi:hypothetical protein